MIRKILNNNFFAFFLVVPFTVWFLSSLFSPVFVSASSSDLYPDKFETGYFNSSTNIVNSLNSVFDSLDVNQSIYLDDYYVFISNYALYGFGSVFLLDKNNTSVSNNGFADTYFSSRYYSFFISYTGIQFRSTVSSNVIDFNSISSLDFSSFIYNSSYKVSVGCPFSWQNAYGLIYDGVDTVADSWYLNRNNNALIYDYSLSFSSSYNPLPSVNNPLSLNIDVDGFYNWLVDTRKDSNFVSYFNLRYLSQYLQFYNVWGSAPQKFLAFYNIEFGDSFNSHLSNLQIIELKNLTDRLYREYLNSLKYPSADFPARDRVNIRKDIDTNTTDNNTVLITDDSNDSVIVSILRDILRGVIALRNQIFVTGTDIITGLNNIDFTVNVANDGGTGFNASDIWGSGSITESENYLSLTAAFMDKGVDVSAAENMEINYLENATQQDSFTVSVVMPDEFVNGQFTEKTVTHTIDNTSKMYNTLILFRKLIAFAVVAYFAIRIRFELPYLIRGE